MLELFATICKSYTKLLKKSLLFCVSKYEMFVLYPEVAFMTAQIITIVLDGGQEPIYAKLTFVVIEFDTEHPQMLNHIIP